MKKKSNVKEKNLSSLRRGGSNEANLFSMEIKEIILCHGMESWEPRYSWFQSTMMRSQMDMQEKEM